MLSRTKKVIRVIDAEDGLTNNTIADIHESDDGKIFLSTFSGISVIQNLHDSLTIRNITNKDGLINNNCLIDGSYLDQDGNLWITTQDGISKYNPKKDEVNTTLPKIYITGLQIFNADFPLNKFLKDPELNHDENYLRFIYTGLNLSAPEQIKYKYRLSGIDKDWVLSDGNSVQYTHLDQGNFVFEVATRNEWGYWSEPVSLAFIINPAWWETWWFRLLFISFISGLLWLAFQYRLNYLLKLERLRTKIASDLHDEVGSLLTQISVNADSLSYIEDSEKIKEKGSFIRSKSTEVINMMSDVIWSIDSRNDNLESLVDRIQNFAQSFLEQKDIALNFSNDIQNLQKTLKIDFRQNIMLIAKEAINNAVKYSDCSKIDIVMNYKNDKFELQISDNGKGFDMQNVKKGNGLKNMKMRAKSIGQILISKMKMVFQFV
ncbi:MAG: ATP-binding protein [Ignavibacteriales bacterium]|nr:ATP-binding protein [Ignavibacteriales bacterium]